MIKEYIAQNKNVLYLIIGTTIAQAIPLLFSPVLSRLYSPESYALLAVMLAGTNIAAEFSTLKYERSIVLVNDDTSAKNILFGCIFITLLISCLSFIVMSIGYPFVKHLFLPHYERLKYLITIISIPMGITIAANYWFQRKKEYKTIVRNKIVQMASITFISIALGMASYLNGLTYGYIAGWLILGSYILYQLKSSGAGFRAELNLQTIKTNLIEYKKFPLYNLAPSLLNTLALSAPIFLIVILYGDLQGGTFNMCRQLLLVPAGFVATAFTQVYFQRIKEAHTEKKRIMPLVNNMLIPSITLGVIMALVIYLWGESFFTFLLGDAWSETGRYAGIYIIAILFRFVSLCIMIILPVLNKLKVENIFKVVYFICISTLFFTRPKHIGDFLFDYTCIETVLFATISIYCVFLVYKNDKAIEQ